MKIGVDWAGVVAHIKEAQRLVLMEMYGLLEEGRPMEGPYRGNENLVPFSNEYRQAISQLVRNRAPVFTYTKEWVLEDKGAREEGTLLSIGLAEYEAMKKVLYEYPGYPENIPEIPGAVEGILSLIRDGHDVELVTSRTPGVPLDVINAWMGKRNLPIPVRAGIKDKTEILHEYDVFIDDRSEQLLPERWCLTLRLLFMHHYNVQDISPFIHHGNCGYVPDWRTILSIVKQRSLKRLPSP